MNVMIVDDHVLFREGLSSLLKSEPDFRVVAEAGSVREAVEMASLHQPDLVLMDYSLPDGDGIEACEAILFRKPQCKIVFLTVYETDEKLLGAIRSGAKGYLLKSLPISQLIRSLRGLAAGEAPLSRKMTTRILEELSHDRKIVENHYRLSCLSKRELEVLDEVSSGASNYEIARNLFISENTVKHHLLKIFAKLEINNRREAIDLYRQTRLADH
jgi:DNA-binding NarL/FixJ family response regulator